MTGRRVVCGIAAVALIGSASAARRRSVSAREERLFRMCNDASDAWWRPMWAVMQAGSLGAVPIGAAVAGRHRGRRRGTVVLITGSGTWLIVKLIKPLVRRGRPTDHVAGTNGRGRPQNGLGYPSGHAAVATALAITTTRRPRTSAIALAIAALVGGSRMYVGAHLPLDVVGGLAIGVMTGVAGRSIDPS